MIPEAILEYVRKQLSLYSLKAGIHKTNDSETARKIEFIWIATVQDENVSWSVSVLYSAQTVIGMAFRYEYKPHIIVEIDENGNKKIDYNKDKSTYIFSNTDIVSLSDMQKDPVREALGEITMTFTAPGVFCLGDCIDFDLYMSAAGGATIHYSYTEGMEIDESIMKLYHALPSVSSQIHKIAQENDNPK